MSRLIILEGIDASGKTTIASELMSIFESKNEKCININRKIRHITSHPRNEELYKFSAEWFSGDKTQTPIDIKALVSVIQLTYLYKQLVLPNLQKGVNVVIDSWWGKTTCNLVFEDVFAKGNVNHNLLHWMYELIGEDPIAKAEHYLILVQEEFAYQIYKDKNKPETILGTKNFDKKFFTNYCAITQRLLVNLANTYNFDIIRNDYTDRIEDATCTIAQNIYYKRNL